MLRYLLALCLPALCAASPAHAGDYPFPSLSVDDRAGLEREVPALAERVLADYAESDRSVYLTNLARLRLLAGRPAQARQSIAELRTLPNPGGPTQQRAILAQYEIYAVAKERQARDGGGFDEAFAAAFRDTLAGLDDRSAALALRGFSSDLFDPDEHREAIKRALGARKRPDRLETAEALALLRAYQIATAYRDFAGRAAALVAQDDARRYRIERDLLVPAPDGARLCVWVVRPRNASGRLPALLNFTIYADPGTLLNEARRSASNGYAGVAGLTRGKGCSPDTPVPYEHDGADAAAVIDWIAAQPWSDGRVGMFGGSYEGFTQWAAAKHRPRALKAIMPSVTAAPGIDVPKEGGIFFGFPHYWPFYVTNNKTLDQAPYRDRARWQRMFERGYREGVAFAERDALDGQPNPWFRRWLQHPDYDAYWQAMIPYREEFAAIDIPVLTTTGYFDGAQIGALYYLQQHYRYRAHAEHYLLVGPYDHISGQRGTVVTGDTLNGYALDPVARIDLGRVRYQWFDHLFKGAPKPEWLRDRINYEVMGANQWKHAPSLAAMGPQRVRLYFGEALGDGRWRLQRKPGSGEAVQTVDLADRSDVDREAPGGRIVDTAIDTANRLVFVSDPFKRGGEISGLFSGQLRLRMNKRDADVHIALYELNANGEYFELSRYQTRLSYEGHLQRRTLLRPGREQRFDFLAGRLTSRRLAPGSRVVALVGPGKSVPDEINYGSGRAVSVETLADAGEPLRIRWSGKGYIELPMATQD